MASSLEISSINNRLVFAANCKIHFIHGTLCSPAHSCADVLRILRSSDTQLSRYCTRSASPLYSLVIIPLSPSLLYQCHANELITATERKWLAYWYDVASRCSS